MPNEVNDQGQQRDVAADNFSALQSDTMFADVILTPQAKDSEIQTEITEEKPTLEEVKPETTEAEVEKLAEVTKEEKPTTEEPVIEALEFKAEDITGFEKQPEDGTFLALAKEMGVEIQEESFEAYKAAIESKIESAKALTKDVILAGLPPEAATTIKLLEMGWSLEDISAPTQKIDKYLSMDSAELIREDRKLLGWDEERIDTELTYLTDKGFLDHEANGMRDALKNQRENIIQQRDQTLADYAQNKDKVAQQQKEQEVSQIKQAISDMDKFMDVPLAKDARDAIAIKLSRGDYDSLFSDPKIRAEFIMYKELGEKAAKHIERTSFEKGRATITKKLLNIPPVESQTGKKVVETNQNINNWDAITNDLGK
jgi:hypothetical protein